ncbi:MAG: hypothetical protein ACI8T1_002635 [Verrucomicrobiales bacterium]|jgi:hypothetical protein
MGKKRKRKGYCGSRKGLKTGQPSLLLSIIGENSDQRAIEKLQNRGLEKLESDLAEDGFIFRQTAPSRRKLSEILLEFVDDELDPDAPLTEKEDLLQFAVTVWNLGVLDSTPVRSIREKMASKAMACIQRTKHPKLFDMLLARKHQDYPNDRRFIRKIDVSEDNDHLFVNVAAVDFDNPQDQ